MNMTDKLPTLNERHAIFVDEYFKNEFNAQDAALAAGYAKASAKQQAHHLLKRPDIKAHIEARTKELHSKNILDADKIIKQLSEMAQVDPADLYHPNGTLKNIHDMPKAVRMCISEIKEGQFGRSVKLEGRQKAIELVGKHLKMWSDAINVNFGSDDKEITVNVNFGSDK